MVRAEGRQRQRRTDRFASGFKPRLTTPLVRVDGELRPATWEVALERAASGFAHTRDTYGPEAFGLFSCSKATNEMNYASQRFIRTAIGSNNIDSCNRT